jgi:hypothetical protein
MVFLGLIWFLSFSSVFCFLFSFFPFLFLSLLFFFPFYYLMVHNTFIYNLKLSIFFFFFFILYYILAQTRFTSLTQLLKKIKDLIQEKSAYWAQLKLSFSSSLILTFSLFNFAPLVFWFAPLFIDNDEAL